ncbi:unnamed protein product [Candidula unifasciata]|uniref:JmjC domain-containing protein n=1 Tax=Candidula unifasciata TaxID=100452 RepID=A0A8S3ZU66_9EUPU|nr:unnamed protein product [Candidula unifasciata]
MAGTHLDYSKPHLMLAFTDKWPCRSWTFKTLADLLGNQKFSCRVAEKSCDQKMETQCSYHNVTIKEFCDWLDGTASDRNPLRSVLREENYGYIDYKYMKDMFKELPYIFDEVRWEDFGLVGYNGCDSTIWIGSEGANTPAHQDTYGFNLVTQIYGRKLWILFPPEDSAYLYPTRVPYEESSIFTEVNVRRPDLHHHPQFQLSHPYVVTLQPGQTLYVPRHWWHYVESIEPSISINVWVPVKEDIDSRFSEAITRCLASDLISSLDTSSAGHQRSRWLNTTETAQYDISQEIVNQSGFQRWLNQKGGFHREKEAKTAADSQTHSQWTKDDTGERICQNVQDSPTDRLNVLNSQTPADHSEGATDKYMLSLFIEKMKGYKIGRADSPFQCDIDVSLPLTAAFDSQASSPKKAKLDPGAAEALSDSEENFTEASSSKIISINPCSFDTYLRFLFSLCRQIRCRHCFLGSGATDCITISNADRNNFSSNADRNNLSSNADINNFSTNADKNNFSSHTEGNNFFTHTKTTGSNVSQYKSSTTSTARFKTSEGGNISCLKDEFSGVSDSRKRKASFDCKDKQCEEAGGDASYAENDERDVDSESVDSGSVVAGDCSELSQSEVAEILLSCTLHPRVVELISQLFRERCQRGLNQFI